VRRVAAGHDRHAHGAAPAQSRADPGPHQRGLARAGGAHEGQQAPLGEDRQPRRDLGVAAEEPIRLGDVVRLEALPRAGRGRFRRVVVVPERGVLPQDGLLEGDHLWGRVDAQLPGKHGPQLPDGAQGLALGAGAVLRKGEQLPPALAERGGPHHVVGAGERLPGPATT
jgi:hypothetical protein